ITDDDLFAILTEVQTDTSGFDRYEMDMFQVQYGTNNIPTATVELTTPKKEKVNAACTGSGSVEALYETLDRIIEEQLKLIDYRISSVCQGKDALADVTVQLLVNYKHRYGRPR